MSRAGPEVLKYVNKVRVHGDHLQLLLIEVVVYNRGLNFNK